LSFHNLWWCSFDPKATPQIVRSLDAYNKPEVVNWHHRPYPSLACRDGDASPEKMIRIARIRLPVKKDSLTNSMSQVYQLAAECSCDSKILWSPEVRAVPVQLAPRSFKTFQSLLRKLVLPKSKSLTKASS
jgi:hypothetical protein